MLMTMFNFFINFLKKYWKSFYLAFLGIFWISCFIYIRLILKRSDYTLDQWRENINWFSLLILIFLLILHLVFLVKASYDIYWDYKVIHKPDPNFNKKSLTLPFMDKFNIIIRKLFIEPLEFIRDFLIPKIPGLDYLNDHFRKFARKYNFYTKGYWLVFLFYILPRGFVATVFFVETIFYNQMYYFIPSLFLLIIPIIWTVFINFIAARGLQFINEIEKYYDIIPIGPMGPMGIYEDGYKLRGKEGYEYTKEALESAANLMSVAIDTRRLSISCLTVYKTISMPYVTAYCSSLYFLGFGYKILFLFS